MPLIIIIIIIIYRFLERHKSLGYRGAGGFLEAGYASRGWRGCGRSQLAGINDGPSTRETK